MTSLQATCWTMDSQCTGLTAQFLDLDLALDRVDVTYVSKEQYADPSPPFRRAFAQRPSNNNQQPRQNQPPNRANTSSPSAYSPSALVPPSIPAAPASPSLTHSISNNDQATQKNASMNANRTPIYFREEHAGFIVKGNFMTLAAKPHLVEEGEWLAHQSLWPPR
jgi:hypothetical protein